MAVIMAVILSSCIKNDIPYPRIQPSFTSFEVEGQAQDAQIDSIARTVTVTLGEEADIYNVRVLHYVISQGGWLADPEALDGGVDMSQPIKVALQLYQTYDWTITARQDIQRYFTVANQIGATTIDVPAHRVVLYVPTSQPLNSVEVLTMKLGSTAATYSPSLEGKTVDFTRPVEVEVTDYGRTETWTIYIDVTVAPVTLNSLDSWSNVAWLYASGQAGKTNGFEYREAGASDWTAVPDAWVSHDGGSFTGCLRHLQPLTNYEARAFSGDDRSSIVRFTTEGTEQLPNSTLDDWWLDGKIWCPWAEGSTPFWGTGNKGATTLGPSNSVPTDDTSSGTGRAAQLETKFVGIGMLGKLAAGNLFAGTYVRTDGTNGILDFGRSFELHPTRLRGYMKYHSAPISSTTAGFEDLKNRPDTCIIWCALIDSDEPFQIRTNPNNRHLFDPSAPDVIAYGYTESGADISSWQQFDIRLNYVATNRRPRYILVVASASKYGDYFTGGNGSVLCVDDFVLDYDY